MIRQMVRTESRPLSASLAPSTGNPAAHAGMTALQLARVESGR
jgi:hypothetical protein